MAVKLDRWPSAFSGHGRFTHAGVFYYLSLYAHLIVQIGIFGLVTFNGDLRITSGTDRLSGVATAIKALSTDWKYMSETLLVQAIYRHALDRDPSAAGLSTWVDKIHTGKISADDFVFTVSESVEHRATLLSWANGTSSDDDLTADGKTWMFGSGGDDALHAGIGSDYLDGGDGNDKIYAGAGDDRLVGGTGNDFLSGEAGNDTFVWSHGDGNDVIDESTDTTSFGDSLLMKDTSTSQISFLRTGSAVTLVIAAGAGRQDGGSVNLGSLDVFGQRGVDSFIFSNENWSAATLRSKVVASSSTDGNDVITGFDGSADLIYGGEGSDILSGLGGNDVFAFDKGSWEDWGFGDFWGFNFGTWTGFGSDRIKDFSSGAGATDVIRLSLGNSLNSFSEVMSHAKQVGLDTVLSLNEYGTIVVENTVLTSLVSDDFMFV